MRYTSERYGIWPASSSGRRSGSSCIGCGVRGAVSGPNDWSSCRPKAPFSKRFEEMVGKRDFARNLSTLATRAKSPAPAAVLCFLDEDVLRLPNKEPSMTDRFAGKV